MRLAAALPVALLLLSGAGAHACDTPVYAYTMQMWAADPYYVFYFHDGAEDATDRNVNLLLAEAAENPNGEVNLRFTSADVNSLSGGAGIAAKVWSRNQSRKLPCHVVTSPRGLDLAAERLTVSTGEALLHSAKRQKLANLLLQGKMGVLLLLLGSNDEEAATARSVVEGAVAEAARSQVDVGVLEVKRSDATEKWFVRQMLAVEDDLKDLDHTMLFGVFGRGHIVEPFMGRGISQGNVLELIGFMGGPCACEIKETAPGTDLLMACDWSRAAVVADAPTLGLGYAEIPITEVPAEPASEPTPAPKPVDPPAKSPAKPADPVTAKAPAPSPQATPVSARPGMAGQFRPRGPRDPAQRGPNLPPPDVAAARSAEAPPRVLPEAGRGPDLPPVSFASTAVAPQPPLRSRLGVPLEIAAGVLVVGVVLGGLALMWVRREQT